VGWGGGAGSADSNHSPSDDSPMPFFYRVCPTWPANLGESSSCFLLLFGRGMVGEVFVLPEEARESREEVGSRESTSIGLMLTGIRTPAVVIHGVLVLQVERGTVPTAVWVVGIHIQGARNFATAITPLARQCGRGMSWWMEWCQGRGGSGGLGDRSGMDGGRHQADLPLACSFPRLQGLLLGRHGVRDLRGLLSWWLRRSPPPAWRGA
jgi:hypothetical protein